MKNTLITFLFYYLSTRLFSVIKNFSVLNMKSILILILILTSFFEVKANINMTTSVFYCSYLEKIVNIEESCGELDNIMAKITCNSVVNNLNILKNILNDDFKAVYTLEEKKIFYFLNGNVYETKCFEVNYIEVIEFFDKCTKYISIKFLFNGQYMSGYLTKEEIIRTDSPYEECKEYDDLYIMLGNQANLVRRHTTIRLIELKTQPKYNVLDLESSLKINKSQLSFWGNINLNYEKVLRYNGIYEFTRDLSCFLIIVCFVVLVIKLFKKTNKVFLERFFNKVIEKNEHVIQMQNENISFLNKIDAFESVISELSVKKPSAPPFEQLTLNETQKDVDLREIISIYPHVSDKIACHYCNKVCKNQFGLNVHLRTCKSK